MKPLIERNKINAALKPQALNNTNVTGDYFSMKMARKVLFKLDIGAMAAGNTATLSLMQATDASASGAKVVTDASAVITANTKVTKVTVDLSLVANTDTVTINDVTFTKAAATSAADRQFADAAGLVTCITNDTYGVEGVTATAAGAVVTVKSLEPGEKTVTVSRVNVAGTITLATLEAQAAVEIDNFALDVNNGFDYVAAKVATTANTVIGVQIIAGDERFEPEQAMAAITIV